MRTNVRARAGYFETRHATYFYRRAVRMRAQQRADARKRLWDRLTLALPLAAALLTIVGLILRLRG